MNNLVYKFLVGLVLITASMAGYGQEKLSLSDAIQKGLKANYDIIIEEKKIKKATNNNAWGEAGKYPKLDFRLNQNNVVTDNIETATPFQLKDQIISNSINPGMYLDWTLFNGFKINITKYRLEKLQEESQGNADIVISNTIQAIILGYYNAVLEKERLRDFEKQMSLSRDKYEYVKVKAEIGGAGTADLLLDETNYLTDSTNFVNQQLMFRKSLRTLNAILAEDPETRYELTVGLTAEVENYDYNDLVAKMENENVDLQKQYLTQAILQYDVGLRRADKQPSLRVNSFYNYNKNRMDLSNASFPAGDGGFVSGPEDALSSITGSYAVNFVLSFNLFNGGKINRAIQNARIQEDIGNVQIDKMKTELRRDLANAYDQYNIRKQVYGINKRKREVADKNVDITTEKYRNGTISSFDFRTVQNNQLIAAVQEQQSIYNLIDSRVELMRLTGGIIEVYK